MKKTIRFTLAVIALWALFCATTTAIAAVPQWRLLWIILPRIDATSKNGTHFESQLSEEDIAKAQWLAERVERYIEEASSNAVDIAMTVIVSNGTVTNLTEDSSYLYVGVDNLPSDVKQEIERTEKSGNPYDLKISTVRLVGEHKKLGTYLGLALGLYSTVRFLEGDYFDLSDTNLFPEQAFIHELSHGFEYFYNNMGYTMPEIDGAPKYGYESEPAIGWDKFLRDNLAGKVKDPLTGALIGIKADMWQYSPSNQPNEGRGTEDYSSNERYVDYYDYYNYYYTPYRSSTAGCDGGLGALTMLLVAITFVMRYHRGF